MKNLRFKVFRAGELTAICADPSDAALLAGLANSGVVTCHGHIVWREGNEACPGAENNGLTASDIIFDRVDGLGLV